ncbi:MAG: glycosyltransferase, partial [Clostridia bacterium]|nr:glycosyltransferase [Clostridia bacterium]
MNTPKLFIVIPCYNEQEALPITARRLVELTDDMLKKGLIDPPSRIVLVDDGSKD